MSERRSQYLILRYIHGESRESDLQRNWDPVTPGELIGNPDPASHDGKAVVLRHVTAEHSSFKGPFAEPNQGLAKGRPHLVAGSPAKFGGPESLILRIGEHEQERGKWRLGSDHDVTVIGPDCAALIEAGPHLPPPVR